MSEPRASTRRSATTIPRQAELTGYDVDVARAVGDKLGVRRVRRDAVGFDIRGAGGQPFRRGRQRGHHQRRTPKAKYDLSDPYSFGEGVIVTRADDDSIKSLADLKGKTAAAERDEQLGGGRPPGGRPRRAVEGFSQAITLLNQGRVDVVVNDSIAVLAYLAETPTRPVRSPAKRREERAGFAARKNSGSAARLNKALDELRADGTLPRSPRSTSRPTLSERAAAPRQGAQIDLAADPRQPRAAAKAAITTHHSANHYQLRDRAGDRVGGGAGRLSSNAILSTNVARFYISLIRGTPLLVQLFIVFFALPKFGVKLGPFTAP